MTEAYLKITLDTEVCLPVSNRTIGGGGSLSCIPGSTLLGCAARVIYSDGDLSDTDKFRLIQSASVSFGDATPLVGNAAAFPVPMSLQHPKSHDKLLKAGVQEDVEPTNENTCVYTFTRPEAVEDREGKEQMVPLSGGWMLPDFRRVSVRKSTSIRTSVGRDGRSRDGLLYMLETLAAGQQFVARIEARDGNDLKAIITALTKSSFRIGRARGSELGQVSIEEMKDPPNRGSSVGLNDEEGRFSLLVLSPLALRDPDTGSPTINPTATALGLNTGWTFNSDLSTVRTRRFSPWNAKRRCPDLERFVITRGSVLTFEWSGEEGPTSDAIPSTELSVGEHTNQGLGRMLVQPKVLDSDENGRMPGETAAKFYENPVAPVPGSNVTTEKPESTLFGWASARGEAANERIASYKRADKFAETAAKWHIAAAQWGQIRRLAREVRVSGAADLKEQIELMISRGVAAGDDGWEPYKDRLLNWIANRDSDAPQALELLAQRAVRHATPEGGR